MIVVEKILLTVEEVAQALRLGRTKTYALILSGAIDSISIGRCRRIPREALEDFVARLQEEAAAEQGQDQP